MNVDISGKGLAVLLREDAVHAATTAEIARTSSDPDWTSVWHYDGRTTGLCVALGYVTGDNREDIEDEVREQARKKIDDINAGRRD